MDEESRKNLEYEEQFFGMSSRFFTDCFKNLIEEELDSKISMMVESVRGKLLQQAANPDEFQLALQKMKSDLTALFKSSMEKMFPNIKSKISKIIAIPHNVLLKEDLPVAVGINGDLNKIKEDIEKLEGTYKSLLYMKQKIMEELEIADTAILLMECMSSGKEIDFHVCPVEDICALSKENIELMHNGA